MGARPMSRIRASIYALIIILTCSSGLNVAQARQSNCGPLPCAQARVTVSDFSQDSVAWSLDIVVNGDVNNTAVVARVVSGFTYLNPLTYGFYDSATNSTSFSDQYLTGFNRHFGGFPEETWYFQFFLSLNASIRSSALSPFLVN